LLREIHGVLLTKGRGSSQMPGEFRRSQNWIGGTRPGNAAFVPPPAEDVLECMSKLELFLHDQPEPTPVLLKAALAHVQFETIHPFLDGNGRLGRLLITLLLCEQNVLRQPMLYLSLYFKDAPSVLLRTAQQRAADRRLGSLARLLRRGGHRHRHPGGGNGAAAPRPVEPDRDKISALGRAAASTLQVHRALMEHPIATSARWWRRPASPRQRSTSRSATWNSSASSRS
jgi:hypothetical protein